MHAARALTRWARWILTHDFTPWANRHVVWIKTPLGVLALSALAALACGFVVAPQGHVVAAALAVVIALGLAWPGLALRGVTAELRFAERRCREGRPIEAVLVLRNGWPWPLWGLCLDVGFDGDAGAEEGAAWALAHVGPWSRGEYHFELRPPRRGVFPRRAARLATGFPFGLWRATRPVFTPESLVVWPATIPLSAPSASAGRERAVAAVSDHRVGDDGDRLGARPYRPGDSLRHVHWALTARHDRLVVSERQGAAQAHARVWVDAPGEAGWLGGAHSAWEWSLRVAASLVESLLANNARVTLRIGDDAREARPCEHGRRALLDFLATRDTADVGDAPRPGEPRRPEALSGARLRAASDGELLIRVSTDTRAPGRGPRRGVFAWVVLPAETFASATDSDADPAAALEAAALGDEHADADAENHPGGVIVLAGPEQALARFARKWRRVCQEAWRGTK